jgi:hypothetical protein
MANDINAKEIHRMVPVSDDIKLLNGLLDGKRIGYHSGTVFLVQVGKGSKGSYKTKYRLVGSLSQAVFYYNAINIGNGWKKRLIVPSFNKPLLARQSS